MKITRELTVQNDLGLHIIPSARILELLAWVDSTVMFTYKGNTVNAKSLTSILALSATKDSKIVVEVNGSDAEKTMHSLETAFNEKFGERK